MNWIVIAAVVLSLWSALRVLGNERQRRVEAIAAEMPPAAAPPDRTPVAG